MNATDAGKAISQLYKDAINKKEKNGTPDNFLHDVVGLATPGDILEWNGKPGLPWTKHNMVDIYRKQLGYFQNESDEEHQVGWFKPDHANFFLREMSLSTLKDMVAIIRLELLPGCANRNNNHTSLSTQVWRNRISIPIGTKYPTLAGLDATDGNAFFADNAPVKDVNGSCPNMAVPISCFTENDDDIDEDLGHSSGPIVVPPPTDHFRDAEFEAQQDPQHMTREDMMVCDISNTKDVIEPDSIIDENDDFESRIRSRGRRKEVESCKRMVRALDRKGVPHPFQADGFDKLVDFFEKSSIPLDLYTTRLSNLYASSSIYDQVRISSLQIAYRQDILAALSVKCDKDLEALNQVRKDMIAKVEHMRSLEKKLLDTARAMDSTKKEVDEAAKLLEQNKSSTKRMLDDESDYGETSEYEALSDGDDIYVANRTRFSRGQRHEITYDTRNVKHEDDSVSPVNVNAVASPQQPPPALAMVNDPLMISRSSRHYSSFPPSPVDASFARHGSPSFVGSPTSNRRRGKHVQSATYIPRVTRATAASRDAAVSRPKASTFEGTGRGSDNARVSRPVDGTTLPQPIDSRLNVDGGHGSDCVENIGSTLEITAASNATSSAPDSSTIE